MSPAQQLVLRWLEFSLATAVLLAVAKLFLIRLKQPADRIHLILLGFAMAALIPVLGVLAPIPRVELGWVGEVRVETGPPVALPEYQSVRPNSASDRPVALPWDHADSREPLVSVPAVASTEETQTVPQSFMGGLSLPIWELTAGLLILIHLLVAGFFLVEWWIASRVLSGIRKRAQMPQPFLLELWRAISQGKSRPVRLLVSGEIAGPMAFGFWQPTILIPESMVAGPTQSLKFCLKHEWAHIENGDLRALGFVWGCQFLLWIQPLFWLLRRDLRICQDFLADHRAAGEGLDRVDYSQLLLDCTKHRLTRPIPGTIALFDRSSHLMKRVRMILESDFTLRPQSHRWFSLGAGVGLLGLAVLFGAVRLHGAGSGAELTINGPEATIPPSENQKERTEDKDFKWIRGTVTDENGQPVPGAKLFLPLGLRSDWEKCLRTEADAMGKFNLQIPRSLLNQKFKPVLGTLWVHSPGHLVAGENVYSVVRGSQEAMEVKFQLSPGSKTAFTVLDSKGSPVLGAKVQGQHYQILKNFEILPEGFSGKTDANGVVQISDINPARLHNLKIQADKFGTQEVRLTNATDPTNRTVRLKETGTIKGRLVSDHPEWVRGVRVALHSRNSFEPGIANGSAILTTNEDGSFEVPHFAADNGVLAYVDLDPSLPVRPQLEETGWVLHPGSTLKMEIPLVQATKVRGILRVKSKKTPVPEAEILLDYGGFRQSERVITDAKGKFEGRVLPGPLRIQIVSLPAENLVYDLAYYNKTIEIPANTKEFHLPPLEVMISNKMEGKLVGAKNQPLSAKEIRCIQGESVLSWTNTDSEGRFSIRVPEGLDLNFEVYTEKQGSEPVRILQKDPLILQYSGDARQATEDAERAKKADVALKGRVLLSGKAVSGVKLTLFRGVTITSSGSRGMRSEEVSKTETDSNGAYRLTGLKAGDSYRIQVNSSNPVADPTWHHQSPYFPKLKDSDRGEIALPDVNLRKLTQTLSGQVVDPDGKPVPGAQVVATMRKTFSSIPRLTPEGPPPWTTTDKEGRFRLEQLPDEPLGIMAYLNPKRGSVIRFPAKTNVELNQKDIRIVLDPSLVEEDQ